MTNSNIIENRISLVQKYLKILERYKDFSRKEIEENMDIRGAVRGLTGLWRVLRKSAWP